MSEGKLAGRRILLVEDEFFQARDIKALLEKEGATVLGPTGSAEDVSTLLEGGHTDAALLDINLGSGPNFATADLLRQEGVPFAFLTGYDPSVIPPEHSSAPRLEKPAHQRKVIRILTQLL